MVKYAMSGNISSSILDHLPQFFILPEFFSNSHPRTKCNIISHDQEKSNSQSFLEDLEKINWNQVLQLNQDNVNITFKFYLNTVNTLINSHARLKKLKKKKRKFQQKPLITKGIQNAIEQKNRLLKKYIKPGDCNKNSFHQECKTYRNSLSTLLKQRKKSYYKNYFRNNINNTKNSWKGIKSITSLNPKEFESPKINLNNKGEFLTNPNDIANQFNNFFCSIAPTIQSNINPNFEFFNHYLTEPCKESFLISPCIKS